MAYDEGLAERLRETLSNRADVVEKKMFGGLAFMVSGHMCVGVSGDVLMARVGPDQYKLGLKKEHARKMDFTGKPLKGFLYVDPPGIEEDDDLAAWVALCESFIATLPPK
ncbi:MAG: TfoX/Sxy family protein [Candidatus Eisenbacteria bacterium]|uniref:TfoX/Sxy family protein n=1 Tax=Eiseniibacteriota bacterium TaxID=2212470 RepID=A0A7Y2EBF0_UNCEI|nr:TfoX/Sxy family protein [Candidatus Eisenbacteria bacterium]